MLNLPKPSSFNLRAGLATGAIFFALASPAALGWTLWPWTGSGPARVIDGDTIELAGERIRLEGIDAPETAQSCKAADGHAWDCGAEAIKTLKALVEGQEVTCKAKGHDKYGRTLGICQAGGKDINAEMVRSGLAWAFVRYSQTYVAEETDARAHKLGVWQSDNQPAWDFRAGRWDVADNTAPNGCAIKGNITNHGAIYHMPWSPWYAKVRIELEKGEKWFCSESEAIAAGWRASQSQ